MTDTYQPGFFGAPTIPTPTPLTDARWPASRLLASMDLAAARETDRLCLADGLGMTVEILADDLRATITSLQSDLKRTRDVLMTLANACDDVGIVYFDTDSLDLEVKAMQDATQAARAILTPPTGT